MYPCSALVNRFREQPKHIRKNQQHALWFSGLRGAMAFALARQSVTDLPSGHGHVLLTATLLTIFFTVLFIGGFTSYALKFLKIECHGPEYADDEVDEDSLEESMEDVADSQKMVKNEGTARSIALLKKKEKFSMKLKQLKTDTSFTTLDTKYLKPFLQVVPSGEGSDSSGATHVSGQKQHVEHQAKLKMLPKVDDDDEELDAEEFSESRGLLMSSKS